MGQNSGRKSNRVGATLVNCVLKDDVRLSELCTVLGDMVTSDFDKGAGNFVIRLSFDALGQGYLDYWCDRSYAREEKDLGRHDYDHDKRIVEAWEGQMRPRGQPKEWRHHVLRGVRLERRINSNDTLREDLSYYLTVTFASLISRAVTSIAVRVTKRAVAVATGVPLTNTELREMDTEWPDFSPELRSIFRPYL